MNRLEAIALLVKAKELGITDQDVDAVLTKHSEVPELPAEELIKPMSILDSMSEEEILYYSTPYYDELQAKKALHEQHLKEQRNT